MKINQLEELSGIKLKWHQKVQLKLIEHINYYPVGRYRSMGSYKMLLWLCKIIMNQR